MGRQGLGSPSIGRILTQDSDDACHPALGVDRTDVENGLGITHTGRFMPSLMSVEPLSPVLPTFPLLRSILRVIIK